MSRASPSTGLVVSPLLPPAVLFGTPDRPWYLSAQGVLVTPAGEELLLLEARVTRFLAHLRVRAAGGGRSRSLLFHALNTPESGFRRLRARLRWAVPATPVSPAGNFPGTPVSHPKTRGASGEDHGGFGLANTHDR